MELTTTERAIKTELDKSRMKRSGQAQFMSKAQTMTSPPREGEFEPAGTQEQQQHHVHQHRYHRRLLHNYRFKAIFDRSLGSSHQSL